MPKKITQEQRDFMDRFCQINLDAKQANLEATCKANAIFEGLMSEVGRLNEIITGMEATIADQSEEIEEQVNVIVKQRDEITGRS